MTSSPAVLAVDNPQPPAALTSMQNSPWLQISPSRMATSTFWQTDMGPMYVPACNALVQPSNQKTPWLIWSASKYQCGMANQQAQFNLADLQGNVAGATSIVMGPTAANSPLYLAGVGANAFIYIGVDFKLYSTGALSPLTSTAPAILSSPVPQPITLPGLADTYKVVGLFVTKDYYWVSAQTLFTSTAAPISTPVLYRAARTLDIGALGQSASWSIVNARGLSTGDMIAGIIDDQDSSQVATPVIYTACAGVVDPNTGLPPANQLTRLYRLPLTSASRTEVFAFTTRPANFQAINRSLRVDAVRVQKTEDGGVWLWWNAPGSTPGAPNQMQVRVQGLGGINDWFDPMAVTYPVSSGAAPAQAQLIDLLPLSVSNAVAISSQFNANGHPQQYILAIGINDQPHIPFPDYVATDPNGKGKAYQRISTRLYGELTSGIDPMFNNIRASYASSTAAAAATKAAELMAMQPDDNCDPAAWAEVANQLVFELQRVAVARGFWDGYIQDTDMVAQMQQLALSEIVTALDVTALVQYVDHNQVQYDAYATITTITAGMSLGVGTVGATVGSVLSALALTTPVGWGIAIGLGITAGLYAAFSLGSAVLAAKTANPDVTINDDQHTITVQESTFTAAIAKQFAMQVDIGNASYAQGTRALDSLYMASQLINEGAWQNLNLGTQSMVPAPGGQIPASLQQAYDSARQAYLRALCPLVCAKRILTGNSKNDAPAKYTKISATHYPFQVSGKTVTYALVQMADQNGSLRTQDLQQVLFGTYSRLVDPQAFFVDPDNVWNIPTTPNWKTG